MKEPLVSVIIPVYNAEKTIVKCLASLISQTFNNFEIIAIDDGSSDNSLTILNDWSKLYKNIRIIEQKNKGAARTRNFGILLSEAKYIMFIDNDDYLKEDYIETFLMEIESDNLDIVIGGYQRVNSKGEILHTEKLKDTDWSKYIIVAPWGRIFRRDFLVHNGVDFFDYGIGEDVVFSLLAYSKTDRIKIIPYVGYYWYYNEASVSNTSQRGLSDKLDLTIVMKEIQDRIGDYDQLRMEYYLYRYLAWYMLFSGRYASPEEFVRRFKVGKKYLDSKLTYRNMFFSKDIKGEGIKNRFIVFVFYLLEQFRFLPVFSKLYCKGK